MNTVYGALYDIVEQHLQEYNKSMPCSKQAFLCAVDAEPGVCDEKQMETMENSVFFESVFISLLSRLPDDNVRTAWEYEMQKEPEEFRQMLLKTVVGSQEAIIKGSCLKNNRTKSVKYQEYPAWNGMFMNHSESESVSSAKPGVKDNLYKVYQKLPLSVRLFLRKMLRRG